MGIFEDVRKYEAEAAYWMLYYPDHKADYERSTLEDERLDIIFSTPLPRSRGGRNSVRTVSDPTGNKAVKLAKYDKTRAAQWLELCEDVEASLTVRLRVFLELRRKYRALSRNDGWAIKVQLNYPYALAKALGRDPEDIDESMYINSLKTFRLMWNRIAHATAIAAARRGLFD